MDIFPRFPSSSINRPRRSISIVFPRKHNNTGKETSHWPKLAELLQTIAMNQEINSRKILASESAARFAPPRFSPLPENEEFPVSLQNASFFERRRARLLIVVLRDAEPLRHLDIVEPQCEELVRRFLSHLCTAAISHKKRPRIWSGGERLELYRRSPFVVKSRFKTSFSQALTSAFLCSASIMRPTFPNDEFILDESGQPGIVASRPTSVLIEGTSDGWFLHPIIPSG
jgi:hypothetical protein